MNVEIAGRTLSINSNPPEERYQFKTGGLVPTQEIIPLIREYIQKLD